MRALFPVRNLCTFLNESVLYFKSDQVEFKKLISRRSTKTQSNNLFMFDKNDPRERKLCGEVNDYLFSSGKKTRTFLVSEQEKRYTCFK